MCIDISRTSDIFVGTILTSTGCGDVYVYTACITKHTIVAVFLSYMFVHTFNNTGTMYSNRGEWTIQPAAHFRSKLSPQLPTYVVQLTSSACSFIMSACRSVAGFGRWYCNISSVRSKMSKVRGSAIIPTCSQPHPPSSSSSSSSSSS